jgi:DNA-binding ferritin-like protein (Dps family)
MIKQTKAYRAALIALADAIAQQDPADVTLLGQDIAAFAGSLLQDTLCHLGFVALRLGTIRESCPKGPFQV